MSGMSTHHVWLLGIGVAAGSAIAFWCNNATAQIIPDATLPDNSRVTTQNNIRIIEGGTQVGGNLFHSFEQFSVPNGTTAQFNNAVDIQNIISRVTGKSISNIDGTISAKSTANLFLINPNGIIFGPNASLDINGSFVASTASSLNFADGTKFSAIQPQSQALLTISVPTGLQFGSTAAPIRNQSQASPGGAKNSFDFPVGLQVEPGKTLALVGGDIVLENGSLTVPGGRIELGSVASYSLVNLNSTNQGWVLGYEGVQNFQNIQLIQQTIDGSKMTSILDVSSKEGSGYIQLQGKSVELRSSLLIADNLGIQDGGDITITAEKLIVRDGAQVYTTTSGEGAGGKLTVNAFESVEVIGAYTNPDDGKPLPSALVSETFATGKAGNITINTRRLRIQDGARISVSTSGRKDFEALTLATGRGGNLIVNASESVEIVGTSVKNSALTSGLFATTLSAGDAGKVTITTGQLIVRDGAAISTSILTPGSTILGNAQNSEQAGELSITARSILLDNKGKLTSETDTGQGGNITLQVQNLLLLRRSSQISTNAGKAQLSGDGGNIVINAPSGFIVAKPRENSDITTNAFIGSGGKVQINATGIFGIASRNREDLARRLKINNPSELDPQNLQTSDITAISQTNPNLNGIININTLDIDPNRGFTGLAVEPEEPKLAAGCDRIAQNQSEFIITGRGGLPPNPREILRNHSTQVNWVSLPETEDKETRRQGDKETRRQGDKGNVSSKVTTSSSSASPIVEAQAWVLDNNGDITLVANVPTTTPHSLWFNPASCNLYQQNYYE